MFAFCASTETAKDQHQFVKSCTLGESSVSGGEIVLSCLYPSEYSPCSATDASTRADSQQDAGSSPDSTRGEAPKVVLDRKFVDSLKRLAEATAEVMPKGQFKGELARLLAPFVEEVAETYRCSEEDAIRAITGVLNHHGEAEGLRVEGPRKTHQGRPAVDGDDEKPEEEEDKKVDATSSANMVALEKSLRMKKLRRFMASSGFSGVNTPKNSAKGVLGRHFWYPLHAAVKANDLEVVEALLWAGSDPTTRDSQRLTPLELCYRLNRSGSHKAVLDALALAMATTPRPSAPPVRLVATTSTISATTSSSRGGA